MILEFEVNNQILTGTDNDKIVNLSNKYLGMTFTFKTSDWNDKVKFALFRTRGSGAYKVALDNDSLTVPHEVLTNDYFTFSLYGVNEDNVRITTNIIKVYTIQSGYTSKVENPFPDDDPGVIEQIYLAINERAMIEHDHELVDVVDVGTLEMVVTFEDESTATYNVVVVKDESE